MTTVDEASGAADSIPLLLERRAREHPDRVALIGNDGTGEYRAITFGELLALSRRLASVIDRQLTTMRVEPGDARIGWMYGNSAPLNGIALFHAVAAIGAVAVPINPASTAVEAEEILRRASVSIVFAPHGADLAESTGERILVRADSPADLAALAAEYDAAPVRAVPPTDPAIVLFTSGTTGRSKGVVHSQRSALAAGAGWSEAFELTGEDVYQSTFPVYAGAGLHFNGLACLLAGCTYVIDEPRPTGASLRRIERFGATVYGAVPSIYHYWLQQPLQDYDLSSLRLLDFGGAVMHRATIEALRAALPDIRLIQTYGLTEAGPGGLYLPPAHLDRKLGSIGSIGSGGLRFRVVADDSATPGGTDVVGELEFRGTSIMLGYLDDPESTAAVFDGEWMRTGDLVRRDDEGFVYFVDRLKDLIIRGGYNISSIEVEEVFLEHPGVQEAAVFGIPHDRLGETVAIALVLDPSTPADPSQLREFAHARLARVKVPSHLVVVDSFPLSPAGKVLKVQLRAHPGLAPWG